jgi:arginine decarboxylase
MQHFTWNINRSRELYNIAHWSSGYFDINAQGRLIACPQASPNTPGIDLYKLSEELIASGLTLPVLVRFGDILRHRIDLLCGAFQQAMQSEDYQANYTAVYPIKVNQQRHVVEKFLPTAANALVWKPAANLNC